MGSITILHNIMTHNKKKEEIINNDGWRGILLIEGIKIKEIKEKMHKSQKRNNKSKKQSKR